MSRKLITLDELRDYCIANSLYSFQSKSDNEALLISVPATTMRFEDDDQAVYLSIKACHTKENANHSYIEDDVMKAALPSFQLKPILASIVEKTDADGNSTLDFNGHDMDLEQDKMNPDEERINYIERIVGVVSPDNIRMEKDPDSDKSYVYADGIVFKDYTYAADILEQRQDVDVSVEILVDQFSYDTKLGVLKIEAFQFSGITLLGSNVKPGMVGSHATIQDYAQAGSNDYIQEFTKAVDKFNTLMAQLSGTKEGENMTKFDELLAQYGVTEDDVTFEHENMSDEELEAAFAEAFGEATDTGDSNGEAGEAGDTTDAGEGEEGTGTDDEGEADDEPEEDPGSEPDVEYTIKCSIGYDENRADYELSLSDKQYALYRLVNEVYESDNTWYDVTVYEKYLVMTDWCAYDKNYKQSYTEDSNGVFTLTGDRVQVYAQYLTQDEIDALDQMRNDYSALVDFKKETEEAAIHAQREAILSDSRYAVMADDEKFQALVANMDNYSLEELTKEVKALHSDFISDHSQPMDFSAKKDTAKPFKQVAYGMMFGREEDPKKPYGNLFN